MHVSLAGVEAKRNCARMSDRSPPTRIQQIAHRPLAIQMLHDTISLFRENGRFRFA